MSLGQLPVVEKIARELLRRLQTMVNNTGLNTPVREVVRPKRIDDTAPNDKQIMLTEAGIDAVPELSHEGNPPAVAKRITFNIRCHLLNDEKACTPIDQLVHMFAADVQKTIVDDEPLWYTFDNNAIDAEFLSEEPITGDGGMDGVNVPIAITYRVSEYNPYEVRT